MVGMSNISVILFAVQLHSNTGGCRRKANNNMALAQTDRQPPAPPSPCTSTSTSTAIALHICACASNAQNTVPPLITQASHACTEYHPSHHCSRRQGSRHAPYSDKAVLISNRTKATVPVLLFRIARIAVDIQHLRVARPRETRSRREGEGERKGKERERERKYR